MIYLRGMLGTFIAIGADDNEVSALRAAADACLRAPVAASRLSAVGWSPSMRRIYVTGPGHEFRQQVLRYCLPARSVPLMRR